jgi:hypothetical protein
MKAVIPDKIADFRLRFSRQRLGSIEKFFHANNPSPLKVTAVKKKFKMIHDTARRVMMVLSKLILNSIPSAGYARSHPLWNRSKPTIPIS